MLKTPEQQRRSSTSAYRPYASERSAVRSRRLTAEEHPPPRPQPSQRQSASASLSSALSSSRTPQSRATAPSNPYAARSLVPDLSEPEPFPTQLSQTSKKSTKRAIPQRATDTNMVGSGELPNSLLNFARNFRDPQLTLVRDLWRMIDLDKDGKVTHRELDVVLNELGVDANELERAELFAQLDEENSGFVTFRDFVRGVEWLQRGARLTELLSPPSSSSLRAAQAMSKHSAIRDATQPSSSSSQQRSTAAIGSTHSYQRDSGSNLLLATLQALTPAQCAGLEAAMLRSLQAKGTVELTRQDLVDVLHTQRIAFDPHSVGLLWRELEPSNKKTITIAQFSKRLRWLQRGLSMASAAKSNQYTVYTPEQQPRSSSNQAHTQAQAQSDLRGSRRQQRSQSSVLPLSHSGSIRSVDAADDDPSSEAELAVSAGLASPQEELLVLQQHVRTLFDLTLAQADLNVSAGRLKEAKGMANALLLDEGLLTYMNDRLRLKVSALRARCGAIVRRCDEQEANDSDASTHSSTELLAHAQQELHKWRGRAKKVQHQLEKEQRERKEAVRDLQVARGHLETYQQRSLSAAVSTSPPLVDTVYADENRDLLLPKRRAAYSSTTTGHTTSSTRRDAAAQPADQGECSCHIM